jgi:excinuclease ABC subunit A
MREEQDLIFSQNYACEDCGISIEELTPRMFSFNNPFGACPTCTGLGSQLKADPELIVPDRPLHSGRRHPGQRLVVHPVDGISRMYFDALSKKYHFPHHPVARSCRGGESSIILYGTGGEKLELHYDQPRGKGVLRQPFEGICPIWSAAIGRPRATAMQAGAGGVHVRERPCPDCGGKRLRKESLAVTVGGMNIRLYGSCPCPRSCAFMER